MRLLERDDTGKVRLTEDLYNEIPPYAILSHTWGDGEVLFGDLMDGTGRIKPGYDKIRFCGDQAWRDGLRFFWVDTCCIDKSNSVEFQEAINSMFRWYRNATKCYTYLADVSIPSSDVDDKSIWEPAFRASRWFTRRWTLQELIAPMSVEFFSREGLRLGDKRSLERVIHNVTGIPLEALRGGRLSDFTVSDRMAWTETRRTTREEDMAYSLFGIFDVQLPLIYGEGEKRASKRLWEEIKKHEIPSAPSQLWQDYGRLDATSFRILKVMPGEPGSPIKGYLREFDIANPPEYNALSYVWGHEPAIHQIILNSKPAAIRPNLFHALQRIRSPREPFSLWVDSICINQFNEAERNAQVKEMANIYRKAQAVWIWLGEEDLTSKDAMRLISRINRGDSMWVEKWWEEHDFSAFDQVLQRPWFRRRWVIQEAAFSANSVIFCGSLTVHMGAFSYAVDQVRGRLHTIPPPLISTKTTFLNERLPNFRDSPATRLLGIIEKAFKKSDEDSALIRQLSLETLVDLSSFAETTDPRDAIFALLSLANDVELRESHPGGSIVPSYGSSLLDVFGEFVLHCCHQSGSLDIICRPWAPVPTSRTYTSNQVDQLQASTCSWIASIDGLPFGRFSAGGTYRLHGRPLIGRGQRHVYNAHSGTKPQVRLGSSEMASTCNGSLYAKGIILAEITQRSTRMANAIITNECLNIARTDHPDQRRSLVNLSDAVWQILCADRDAHGRPAPMEYRSRMKEVLQLNSDIVLNGAYNDQLGTMPYVDVEELLAADLPEGVREFLRIVQDVVWNRRTFRGKRTTNGSPVSGLIPQQAKVGDQLCILYGCSVPVVLRQRAGDTNQHYWELMGEAYVHGFMDGNGISSLPLGELKRGEVEFEIR